MPDIYANALHGPGATIEDFRPVAGGPGDFGSGFGAEERIAELLGEASGTPGNNAPDTSDDTAATDEDTPVTISALDLLSNDSDPDGNDLNITSVGSSANGTAVLNADGTITYSPNADFSGTGSFTYTVSDGNGGFDTATVTVTVNAAEDAPDAANDTASSDTGGAIVIDVLANDNDPDGDALSVTGVTQGAAGGVSINANGTLTYTPYPWAFQGNDSFSYTISDGNGGTSTATVTISPFPTPIFDVPGERTFDGSSGDVINQAHDPSLAIDQGTIAFSFAANSVIARQGLVYERRYGKCRCGRPHGHLH